MAAPGDRPLRPFSVVRTRKCHIAHQSPPRIVAIPIGVAAEASLGVACIKPPPSARRRGLCPGASPPEPRNTPLPSASGPVVCASGIRAEGQNAGFPSTRPVRGLRGKRYVRDVAPFGGESRDRHPAGGRQCRGRRDRGKPVAGLCEPAMTGIGGDCFALVKPAGSEDVIALNGSGRAPAALSAAEMRAAGHRHMPLFGAPEPVTVPGAVDAFCRLSEDHGKAGPRRGAGPRHPLCRGRRSRGAARRLRLEEPPRQPQRAGAGLLPDRRRTALPGSAVPTAAPGRGAAQDRGRGARRLLRGRGGRGHGRVAQGYRRRAHAG
jgi:hypothetical protein